MALRCALWLHMHACVLGGSGFCAARAGLLQRRAHGRAADAAHAGGEAGQRHVCAGGRAHRGRRGALRAPGGHRRRRHRLHRVWVRLRGPIPVPRSQCVPFRAPVCPCVSCMHERNGLEQNPAICRTLTRMLGGRWEAKLPHGWASHFRNDKDHRDFTAIGASAGACPARRACTPVRGIMRVVHALPRMTLQCVPELAASTPCASPHAAWSGLSVAFAAPISGVVFIAEESAANLGAPIQYRALAGNCIAVLALNVLAAAYHYGPGFWDTR